MSGKFEILIITRICNVIGSNLASHLQSPSYHCNVAFLCLFYKYFHGNCSDELSPFGHRIYEFKHNTRLTAKSHLFTVEMAKDIIINFMLIVSSITFLVCKTFLASCFLVNFALKLLKINVNRYLLS